MTKLLHVLKKFLTISKKYSIPLAIVIGTGFVAISIYSVQVDKRRSIEEQQRVENERAELKLKQEECADLKAGLMKKWNNVVGVKYKAPTSILSELASGCMVVYIDSKTGSVEESPLEYMETTK